MPIIPIVGRKKTSMRLLIAAMYVLLTGGAFIMIYPFLLMLGMSVTSEVDRNELRIIPRYIYNSGALYSKYLDRKYNGDAKRYNEQVYLNLYQIKDAEAPKARLDSPGALLQVTDYEEFKRSLPDCYKVTGFTELRSTGRPTIGEAQKSYQEMLSKKFAGSIDKYNTVYSETLDNFQLITAPREQLWLRNFQNDDSVKTKEWLDFRSKLSDRFTYAVSGESMWWRYLATKGEFNGEITKFNAKYKTEYKDFNELRLSKTVPVTAVKTEWEQFVRSYLPLQFIRFTKAADAEFTKYVTEKYMTVAAYNKLNGTNFTSFSKIPVPDAGKYMTPVAFGDLGAFVKTAVSSKNIYTETTENLFEKFLTAKYQNLTVLNLAYKTGYKNFAEINPPYALTDWLELLREEGKIRWNYITRNYAEVLNYVVLHGNAVFNTIFYCTIMVLSVLTVNPLCAYVLSRFNFSYSYKILLFFLATMAFPYEVSMIPNFILLKKLGFLNTFWALILPGLASGFSIFNLKGFFDSLPKELFEAAKIDGVSEMGTFWKIVLPLTKPVMAYLALGAYTAAYGAFMFALVVCQDPKMWTIMVWLFDMQNWAPQYLIMTALVLAALPTLIVFVLFQNVIIKGIILPVEQ